MRRGWIAGVLTALVLGGWFAVTAALVSSQADGDRDAASAANRQAGEATATTTTTPPDTHDPDEADGGDPGSGPPPWARSNKAAAKDHGKDAAWKEAWRQLTPAQRARKMTRLSKAHAEGMRTWKSCVDAAADETQRAACEKPLPPGLAKKQLQ